MRHSHAHHVALNAIIASVFGVACAQVEAAETFCDELSRFARGLNDSESREVTLFTEWSAQPTRACRHRPENGAERRFCGWLGENAAIEYMEVNVWNAIACVTSATANPFPVGASFSGETSFSGVKLGGSVVDVELDYSVRSGREPDMLRIRVADRRE